MFNSDTLNTRVLSFGSLCCCRCYDFRVEMELGSFLYAIVNTYIMWTGEVNVWLYILVCRSGTELRGPRSLC